MTTIESKKVNISADRLDVVAFLKNMNNIEKLLPQGKYSEWKSTNESCSFKIQNAYTIVLDFMSEEADGTIIYKSGGGSPFAFTLTSHVNDVAGNSEGYMVCDADINPFLKMVVQGPLKNLFDYMAERLVVQFASN